MKKKKWGDRRDAFRVRGLDAMHVFMPYLLPNRADNEAFISEDIDLTPINAYLAEKNKDNPAYKYTIFHVVLAAIAKTIEERPKMNRYIEGHRLYQRHDILLSFVAKRIFSDDGEEALIIHKCEKDCTIDSLHDAICRKISRVRGQGEADPTTKIMNALSGLPRFLLRMIVGFLNFLEYHDLMPDFIRYADPYHSTVFVSNLGSIKLNSGYHHLTNWGNNSLFVVIGQKHFAPVYQADGTSEVREVLPLGITLDERIADGYYYAKTIAVLKKYLSQPHLLDLPTGAETKEKEGVR